MAHSQSQDLIRDLDARIASAICASIDRPFGEFVLSSSLQAKGAARSTNQLLQPNTYKREPSYVELEVLAVGLAV